MNPLDIVATPAMLKISDLATEEFNGYLRFTRCPYSLSDAAEAFIRDNGFGEFTVVFAEDMNWPLITAPDEQAATLFRLAF